MAVETVGQAADRVSIVPAELPVLLDTLHLDTAAREAINGHARHLENWMSGILNWHEGCHRYAESDLISNTRPARPAPSGWLTGLGTSAALRAHRPAAAGYMKLRVCRAESSAASSSGNPM